VGGGGIRSRWIGWDAAAGSMSRIVIASSEKGELQQDVRVSECTGTPAVDGGGTLSLLGHMVFKRGNFNNT
jgi:hypothetical protein